MLHVPKSKRFSSVSTAKDFHAVYGIIIIFVVHNHTLLDRDLFRSITYIDHAE